MSANNILKEPAGILIKTTLVDFPGLVAGSFFLKGCNLRCPYCYNKGLVIPKEYDKDLNTLEELFIHLEKRQGILSGLVISGGEPLINPLTPIIIKKAKELGYKIKIDTNGLLPKKLKELIDNNELRPDFVAMDIKTSPLNYTKTLLVDNFNVEPEYIANQLMESAKIISSLPSTQREWRTVLVPPLVKKENILEMSKLLPPDASWYFAQFKNENCIDSNYNNILPYIDSQINELITYAKSLIQNSFLR